jgi:hypothetical protein
MSKWVVDWEIPELGEGGLEVIEARDGDEALKKFLERFMREELPKYKGKEGKLKVHAMPVWKARKQGLLWEAVG